MLSIIYIVWGVFLAPREHTHLYGDVLVGFIVIAILAVPWFAVRGAQRTPA